VGTAVFAALAAALATEDVRVVGDGDAAAPARDDDHGEGDGAPRGAA
jgi:hypothetical protein